MSTAPIVVHRIQGDTGRRVTIWGRIKGVVYSDASIATRYLAGLRLAALILWLREPTA